MPIRISEKSSPDSAHLELVRGCAARLQSDRMDLGDWVKRYADAHSERIAHDLGLVERFAKPDDIIIEVGAIPLLLTAPLKQMGYNVTGLDIDPSRFETAITEIGVRVLACNIETAPLPLNDECADVVIFNELFEHLRINPIFTMREIHRVLKPGGRLMLSTPSLRSLRGLANLLLKDKSFSVSANLYEAYEKLEWLGHMGHVREYTATEVTVFLDRLGFDIDALVFRGRDPNNLINRIIGVFPALKPFVTYVARRRETV